MTTPTSLTTTEGYALQDAKQAVRPDVDTLVTRQAYYAWDAAQEAWTCTHAGLRVAHVYSVVQQRGYRWHVRTKAFVPCTCTSCTRKEARR